MAAAQYALRRVLGLRNAPLSVLLKIYKSNLQQRAFHDISAVKRAAGPVPKFEPTTNPNLDAILNKIREDDIIPAYLPQNYYRLIYRPKNHENLERNPIAITLDDEPYTLKPKFKQPACPGKVFNEALSLMSQPADFAVLPELIRGYNATSSVAPVVFIRIVRRIIKSGNIDAVMEILRTAGRSGFRFNKDIAREIMFGFRLLEQQPDRASVVKAVRYTKELLTVIGKREMYVDPKSTTRYCDDPIILGTALSIYADASLRSHEKWHEDAAEELLLRLKNMWKNIEWNPTFEEYNETSKRTKFKLHYFGVLEDIKGLTVVLEGMLQAKKVFGKSAPGLGPESSPLLETEGEEALVEPGPEPESSLFEAEDEKKEVGEPGPEPEPESSPLLETGREGLEAEGGGLAGSGALPPRKPKRVRETGPALLPWLETESERLATLITVLQGFIDKNKHLVSLGGVGKEIGGAKENKAGAEGEANALIKL